MTLPNFFIVGAAKSGTTSLWSYLRQHPQVFMSRPKEPNFFAFVGTQPSMKGPAGSETIYQKIHKYSILDIENYTGLFDKVSDEVAIGEASVRYLYFPGAAQNIKQYIPNAKILIMLRNPVDRLFSHYCMNVGMFGLEPLELSKAIKAEASRIKQGWGWDWHYINIGLYYEQVKRYLDLFGQDQVKIILYDDFCSDTLNVIADVYRFLGVDDKFIPNTSKKNKVAHLPKNRAIHQLLNKNLIFKKFLTSLLPNSVYETILEKANRLNSKSLPSLLPSLRVNLEEAFKNDSLKLSTLIQRDLSIWFSS